MTHDHASSHRLFRPFLFLSLLPLLAAAPADQVGGTGAITRELVLIL